jgi:hypothetical protein
MHKEQTKPNYVKDQYFKDSQVNLSYRIPNDELYGKVRTIIFTNDTIFSISQIFGIIFKEPKVPTYMESALIQNKKKSIKRILDKLIYQGCCKLVRDPIKCGGLTVANNICYQFKK